MTIKYEKTNNQSTTQPEKMRLNGTGSQIVMMNIRRPHGT